MTPLARQVSVAFFETIGVAPIVGRSFGPTDQLTSGVVPIVIGFDLWRSYFARDQALIGRRVSLAGRDVEIIGVMPQGFDFPWGANAWVPLHVEPQYSRNRFLLVIARVDGDVPPSAIAAQLESYINETSPDLREYRTDVRIRSLQEVFAPEERRALALLLAAALTVLVLAWLYVTGRILRRLSGDNFMAIALTLGVTSARLGAPLVVEISLVAALSLFVAVLISPACLSGLMLLLPDEVTAGFGLGITARSIAFAFVVTATSAAIGCVVAVVAVLEASR